MQSRSRLVWWKPARSSFVQKPEDTAARAHTRCRQAVVTFVHASHDIGLVSAGDQKRNGAAGIDRGIGERDPRFCRTVHRKHPAGALVKRSSTGKKRSG